MRPLFLAPLMTAALSGAADDLLATLTPHPRLLLSDLRVAELRDLQDNDPRYDALVNAIHAQARALLDTAPLERTLVGEKRFRLLETSRTCLGRVLTLGVSYRLHPDDAIRARLLAELKAVCAFSDWHPQHFLDTAEMSAAVAIGYDWLHPSLSEAERQHLRKRLIALGLEPGLNEQWWVRSTNNWNQVCHGGMVLGALAVAEDADDLARGLIRRALDNTRHGLEAYAPHGVYPEGPNYWSYGTSYTILTAAALHTALGNAHGLCEAPGFTTSFDWITQVRGPLGMNFNYADCSATGGPAPWLGWAASAWNRPDLFVQFQRDLDPVLTGGQHNFSKGNRFLALAAVWYGTGASQELPTAWWSGSGAVQVALLRSAWNDPQASFVGIKGGRLRVNHGHLDIGSFVYDAVGVRWAHDLGMEKEIYDRTDSWGQEQNAKRWEFFRANNFSHNTLTVGEAIQRVDGHSDITRVHTDADRAHAIIDMSDAYAGQAAMAKRGIALVGQRRSLLVRDEIRAATGAVRWTMVTRAEVAVATDGRSAILREAGQSLTLRLINAPSTARLRVTDCLPPTPAENQNEGFLRILIEVEKPASDLTLSVVMIPQDTQAPADLDQALADWAGTAP